MTKSFLSYTAFIEGLTGLALILAPTKVALILFNAVLSESVAIILAMVGGAAILSLSRGAWVTRSTADTELPVKILLIYNGVVSLILLYSVLQFGFGGFILWFVILFHFCQTGIALGILRGFRKLKLTQR